MRGVGSPQTATDVVAKQSLGSWSLLWSLNSHSQWRIQDFPGGAPTLKVGVQTYFFGRKPHENERILAPQRGTHPWHPP